jgi:hypothetical protein
MTQSVLSLRLKFAHPRARWSIYQGHNSSDFAVCSSWYGGNFLDYNSHGPHALSDARQQCLLSRSVVPAPRHQHHSEKVGLLLDDLSFYYGDIGFEYVIEAAEVAAVGRDYDVV